MNPRVVLMVFAVVDVLFGLPLLLAPGPLLGNFGVEAHPDGLMLARDSGVSLLALALLNWMGRDLTGQALRVILYSNLLFQGGSAVVNLIEVALGLAPTGVLPGEGLRILMSVAILLTLRKV